MSTKVFGKYIPVRAGHTGAEFIQHYLDVNYPNVSHDPVISDKDEHYIILEGTGDEMSKAISVCEKKFSFVQMTEDEFVGICNLLYVEPDGGPTFTEMMATHGITIGDAAAQLVQMKKGKCSMMKQTATVRSYLDGDNIANVVRLILLKTEYYDGLSSEDKTTVDGLIDNLKAVYTEQLCITGLQNIKDNMDSISGYYTAKATVDAAADKAAVAAVEMDAS